MKTENAISAALADYLEAIYILSQHSSNVRITDIAEVLQISKPSVNRAVNTLKKHGFVEHEPYGGISLTDMGRAEGEQMYKRHRMIKRFLVEILSVNNDEAEKEAGALERCMSRSTVNLMEKYIIDRAV